MPFLDDITRFIDAELKGGHLNRSKLQPAKFHGIASQYFKKSAAGKPLELYPGVVGTKGTIEPITPNSTFAIQTYHRLLSKVYSLEKKSFGDEHSYICACELLLLVLTNSKITGKAKEVLEPLILFGLPQKLSSALQSELQVNSCLIQPIASDMDALAVFKREFPTTATPFVNEEESIFSIKYKVTLEFSRKCVELCLCDSDEVLGENVLLTENNRNLLAEP